MPRRDRQTEMERLMSHVVQVNEHMLWTGCMTRGRRGAAVAQWRRDGVGWPRCNPTILLWEAEGRPSLAKGMLLWRTCMEERCIAPVHRVVDTSSPLTRAAQSILTEEDVARLRAELAVDGIQRHEAARLGVSASTLCAAITGRSFSRVGVAPFRVGSGAPGRARGAYRRAK